MSGELTGLLERVRAATGPDREIDRDIGLLCAGWKFVDEPPFGKMIEIDGDLYPDHPGSMYPSFTESLDVIVELIEWKFPNFYWIAEKRGEANFYGTIMHPIGRAGGGPEKGAAPALALCAAFLATLSAQEDKPK